jgi:hypothetical protein
MTALALALLMTAPARPAEPGFTFPPQTRGGATAVLGLQIPEQGPGPGRARARLTLEVTGPAGLSVEFPRLEDALAGWRVGWACSSWAAEGGRASCELTLGLVQTKPGAVPLPGVTVRVREGGKEGWQTFSWSDLLNEERDVPPPEAVPPLPPSPWPARFVLVGVALVGAALLALVVQTRRIWRSGRRRPLPPHERALGLLEATPGEPAAAATHLDAVLRGYLQERFGVEASRKTKGELLAALREKGDLPVGQEENLEALLGRFDLIKFAGQQVGQEVHSIREGVGGFIRQTAPAGGNGSQRGEGKPGENQGGVEGG